MLELSSLRYRVIETVTENVKIIKFLDDDKRYVARKSQDRKRPNFEERAACLLQGIKGVPKFVGKMKLGDSESRLIFEYIEGVDLFNYFQDRKFIPMSETQIRPIIRQVVEILKHVHAKRVAHMDIKLENIILSDLEKLEVFLIDFGLCTVMDNDDELSQRWIGSIDYCAPEIMARIPYNPFLTDIFSLGVCMYILLNGETPYDAEQRYSLCDYITLDPTFNWKPCVSKEARELVTKMMRSTASERPSLDEILDHEWMMND
jgi:serine/threonine protein kinase